jgi:hypothetical protein
LAREAETQPAPGAASEQEKGVRVDAHAHYTRRERTLLRTGLEVYALVQYIWKVLQWLIITVLILVLLLVVTPLRLVSATGFSAVLDSLVLYWVSEAALYTQDYARSSGLRESFEREVLNFLYDDRCERIVVIAHSMGTVVAYDGLTTILDQSNFRHELKPVTFICLAQALRRQWLMIGDEPNRLRGVLPDRVRWLHFWARYDPVAAGPLHRRSLPRPRRGASSAILAASQRLADRLDACENVDVVNTDSAFTDHTKYWRNQEQVVGPIVAELVAGHPDFEALVRKHLATADDVIARRVEVAWRSSVALLAGLGLGLALFLWDAAHRWSIGSILATHVFSFLGNSASSLLTLLSDVPVLSGLGNLVKRLHPSILHVGLSGFVPSDERWSIVAAVVIAGLGILSVGRRLKERL